MSGRPNPPPSPPPPTSQNLFDLFDTDKNGAISFDEFENMMRELDLRDTMEDLFQKTLDELKLAMPNPEELTAQLGALDLNKDGQISVDELSQAFGSTGDILNDVLAQIIMVAIGDGQAQIDEVSNFFTTNIQLLQKLIQENSPKGKMYAQINDIYLDAMDKFAKPMAQLKPDFDAIAEDDYVTREELTDFIKLLPETVPSITENDIEEIVKAADIDGDGQINYEDFSRAYFEKLMLKRFDQIMFDTANLKEVPPIDVPFPVPPGFAVQAVSPPDVDFGGGGWSANNIGMEKLNSGNNDIAIDLHMVGFVAFVVVLVVALIVGILNIVVQCVNNKRSRRRMTRTYVNEKNIDSEDDELVDFM